MIDRPIVLVDMDDTTVETSDEWMRLLKKKYGAIPDPARMENYDIATWYPELTKDQVFGVIDEPGFFASLKPRPGAIAALYNWLDVGIDVRFATVVYPGNRHGYQDKLNWIHDHIPTLQDRMLCFSGHDKTLLYGSVLVDDAPKHIENAMWAVPVVFDRPWNKHLTNRVRAHNWLEVQQHVGTILYSRGLLK